VRHPKGVNRSFLGTTGVMNRHQRERAENEFPDDKSRLASSGSSAEDDLAGEDDVLDDDQFAEEGDFAEEHTRPTFADDQDGGPEGIREPESPRGKGGDGGMD
jgi:hypothetical protein